METRVRYAPSPTGLQHIGGVRTALFNYLFAKSTGGKFILRLEDTDRTRYSDAFVKNLYDTFNWLGFYWDEGPDIGGEKGPYIQSERFDLYREYAEKLVSMGKAYYCFCKEDKVKEPSKDDGDDASLASSNFGYPRTCRNIDPEEAKRRVEAGESHVIRLKIPLSGITAFDDELLGHIEWKNEDVNPDPILLKTDGFPTYHLANVIDDHFMGITQVMRAQEWIPSAPLHILMYEAFGWTPPKLCHLPMVLGEDGHKLSKRHGATSVDEFRKKGYLPNALINYVAMLGASYEDGRDIYSLDELAKLFSIKHLNKAPAVFDYVKLEWFNGQYIRMLTDLELVQNIKPYLEEAGLLSQNPSEETKCMLLKVSPLIKERLKYLSDAPSQLAFFFNEPSLPEKELFIPKKQDLNGAIKALTEAIELLKKVDPSDHESAEAIFRARASEIGLKLGDLMMPLRVAITGTKVSPPMFPCIAVLGKEKAILRAEKALEYLKK